MHDLQALVDGWSAHWQRERAATQMTLGKLIDLLEMLPPNTPITGLGSLCSYRGYYCDLAFEPTNETTTAAVLLVECRAAMGKVFTGYKGGDYMMGESTPLWVANYGCCGQRLINLDVDGDGMTPKVESEPASEVFS